MKNVIIGTAGHIDHGKTSLVRALTGIDADRLKEEKQRGITIDIGFASLDVGDVHFGFVDVPGHERFVKNMLAGAHGVDLVILVIAADESVMPQTREHFDICRMLGVRAGLVALTKADMVDSELLELAHAEVEEFVEGSFLEGAPIVAVSSTTGLGIEDLKAAFVRLASAVPERRTDLPFRLPIDRAFTMRGFGTVVTGTLIAGEVATGDTLELQPGGRRVKVRGVQVHSHQSERAFAGQRTAINLQGVELEDVERGQVLIPVGRFQATSMVDVRLQVLSGAPRPLEHRARIRFHHGTSESLGRVVLLGRDALEAGGEAIVQIRLESPVLAAPGDRFIVRSYSPQATIGGGVILDALALKHRQSDTQALVWLEHLEAGDERERIRLRLERAGVRGISLLDLAAQTGLTDHTITEQMAALVREKRAVEAAASLWFDAGAAVALRDSVLATLKAFHKRDPLAPGMSVEELRSVLFSQSPVDIFRTVTAELMAADKIVRDRDVFVLAGRGSALSPEDQAGKASVESLLGSVGLEALQLGDVAARAGLPEPKAKKYCDLLTRDGKLVRLGDLLYHRTVLDDLKTRVQARKAVDSALDIAAFRELTGGLSRKYTIPLLEWLDRERVTRRVGDKREIL